MEDDYLVWFNVPVGRMRRYPDFVILHPNRGLLVLEVKDWKIADFVKMEKVRCEVTWGGKHKTVANPLEQARQCAIELVNTLQRDPQLCDSAGRYQGSLAFPWGYGVVMPNATRRQW